MGNGVGRGGDVVKLFIFPSQTRVFLVSRRHAGANKRRMFRCKPQPSMQKHCLHHAVYNANAKFLLSLNPERGFLVI